MSKLQLYLGGSFDPIHNGHLGSAQALAERLSAATTCLLPAKRSPLKHSTFASDGQREAMLRLALADCPKLQLDLREMRRGGASYTHQTLQELRGELGPNAPLAFAMGMDSFIELNRWQRWQDLTDLAHLVVFARPGYAAQFSAPIEHWLKTKQTEQAEQLEQQPNGLVWFTELTPFAISSTELRALCQQSDSVKTLERWLPSQVAQYIEANQLYR